MGNGMMCTTTPKTGVLQGVANKGQSGAAPPPPPTGAVGGGAALHLSAVVVLQTGLSQGGFDLVPMSAFAWVGGTAGRGHAFALFDRSTRHKNTSSNVNGQIQSRQACGEPWHITPLLLNGRGGLGKGQSLAIIISRTIACRWKITMIAVSLFSLRSAELSPKPDNSNLIRSLSYFAYSSANVLQSCAMAELQIDANATTINARIFFFLSSVWWRLA